MSFVGASDDFDLDDDGILRDSMSGAELLIDDDGILRDDAFDVYKHEARGQWIDSGFSGDKQSTTSTLQHLHNSFEDLAPIGDESINISELEASRDDLSFDRENENFERNVQKQDHNFSSLGLLDTLESTFEKPFSDNYEPVKKQKKKTFNDERKNNFTENTQSDLFPPEYYQQLRELGVLVDGVDLSRDSLDEFEEIESKTENLDEENKEHDDLIAEYLASEYRREEEEERNAEDNAAEKQKVKTQQPKSKVTENYSRASSAQTLSSHSFPDEVDDYGYDNLSQNLGSQAQSQKTQGDDEEILNITSKIFQQNSLEGSKILGGNVNSSFHGGIQAIYNRGGTPTPALAEREDANYAFSESAPQSSRPSSAISHFSTTSDIVFARQKKAEEAATQRMLRARSQEELVQKSGDRTQQKRLLPTMSSSEPTHSFKLKSKSVSNIASKSGPVKPTHMTISEISLLTDAENQQFFSWEDKSNRAMSVDSDSAGELSTRLTQEAQKRKQATELVQQLQKDYDNLLTKYALAELTIDQMRLGAKITVHTDSPTPLQVHSGVVSPIPAGQAAQVTSLRHSPSQAVKISTFSNLGHTSPLLRVDAGDQTDGRHTVLLEDQRSRSRPDLLKGSFINIHHSITNGEDGGQNSTEIVTETVKADMFKQTRDMEEKLESFYTLLEQRQLTLEEQEKVFENIKSDHEKLRRSYLQAKDDYNVLRRSGAITTDAQNFDENKELEGHLFRLGMRFDEVQEKVEKNMKEKPVHRQPFSSGSNRTPHDTKLGTNNKTVKKNHDKYKERLTDDQGHSLNTSRSMSLGSTDDADFEQRVQELKSEYNTSMDMYRKLKYMSGTPEGEKQIEDVVVKLHNICTEMPDMFRLSPEIQARISQLQPERRLQLNANTVWEKVNKKENHTRSQRNSPLPHSSRNGPIVGTHHHGAEHSDSDSSRARFGGSTRSSLGSILPDRIDHSSFQNKSSTLPNEIHNGHNSPSATFGGHQEGFSPHVNDRPSSRSRRSSRGEDNSSRGEDISFSDRSFHANDISNTNLPRPRKHAHELKDPKMTQLPDTKSLFHTNSGRVVDNSRRHSQDLHDSDTKGAYGGTSHRGAGISEDTEGALAALPGPGKFKQMTKQRAADDADSGFIGSMVGSGVGEPPAVVQQGERPLVLKLRHPADESSTVTDESFDRSSQASTRSGTKRKSNKQRDVHRHEQSSGSNQREVSYDGEEDTLETIDSEVSSRSEGKVKTISDRQKIERHKRDAALDDEHSTATESDQSTPRATPTVKNNEMKHTGQTPSRPQTPAQLSKTHLKSQTSLDATVNKQILTSKTSVTKVKESSPERNKTSHMEESVEQQNIPPSLIPHHVRESHFTSHSRPSSRGSPTTDLLHTRSRRTSIESERSSRRVVEPARSDLEMKQERVQLRHSQQNIQSHDAGSASLNLPPGGDEPPFLLPHDLRHEDMVKRGKEYEERSVGSDVEVGSSITTRASSVNSNTRLKALQEEIEKLKEGFARANEKSSHPPPPPQIFHMPAPQLPAAEGKQEPEYYDPFDDPYGFMRMPRRRANSFSGGRERDWDEWYWTLPQNRQYDGGDIPLGYAAADAYAENPRAPHGRSRERNTKENVRNRLRQKRLESKHQGDLPPSEPQSVGASGETFPHPPPGGAEASEEAAMHNYYIPSRFSTEAMRQQIASQGYFTTPSGGKIYSSTGEEADNEDERVIYSDSGYRQRTSVQAQNKPWYQIKRSQNTPPIQGSGAIRAHSYNDIRTTEPQRINRTHYLSQVRPPNVGTNRMVSQSCPICGMVNYHTHAAYIHRGSPPVYTAPSHYSSDTVGVDHYPGRLSRSRSKSRPRGNKSNSRSRYKVRQYNQLSISDNEEEEEERIIRRTRSLSRGRPTVKSKSHRDRRYSNSPSDISGDDDNNLDRSLSLSMDISRLTSKMLGTLKSELMMSRLERDYGSTYW